MTKHKWPTLVVTPECPLSDRTTVKATLYQTASCVNVKLNISILSSKYEAGVWAPYWPTLIGSVHVYGCWGFPAIPAQPTGYLNQMCRSEVPPWCRPVREGTSGRVTFILIYALQEYYQVQLLVPAEGKCCALEHIHVKDTWLALKVYLFSAVHTLYIFEREPCISIEEAHKKRFFAAITEATYGRWRAYTYFSAA